MVNAEPNRNQVAPALIIGSASAVAVFLPPLVTAVFLACALAIPLVWWTLSGVGRWLTLFFFVALLLPPLPIPLGDTGPHPAILIAALGVISGVVRLDQWRWRWRTMDVAVLALTFALTVSVGFAALYSGVAIAVGSAIRVALFCIGVSVYFASTHGPERDLDGSRMTRTLFAIGTIAALFGCIDFLYQLPAPAGFEPQFLWLESGVYRRAQGLFYESSTLGNFCSFFLVFVAVAIAEHKPRRILPIPVLAIGAVVFASAMLLSFSRASVIACLISLATLAWMERARWFSRRSSLWVALLVCAAVVLFAISVPEVAEGYWGRVQLAFGSIQDSPDRALSGRLESWTTVFGFILEHPLQTFFGIGYKTLPYTQFLGRSVIADNMYLSLLVETGVFGLLALLALNFAILVTAWKAQRLGSFYGKWLFCFWIGESLQMLSGDILTYWRVLPLYFW
ncbi:MAG: O-antigen ligase family protein, partial [Acidobacteriota bacterium]